jgi:site-specific DNA-cytosine methylase
MTKKNQKIITDILHETITNISVVKLDASQFGVQTRKRLYWTNFIIKNKPNCTQTWDDVLEPLENIQQYIISDKLIEYINKEYPLPRTISKPFKQIIKVDDKRWKYFFDKDNLFVSRLDYLGNISDTMDTQILNPYPVGKSRTITTSTGNNNLIIDRRTGNNSFIVRQISPIEKERLFYFPDNWTEIVRYKTPRGKMLGNTVVINVIEYLLQNINL